MSNSVFITKAEKKEIIRLLSTINVRSENDCFDMALDLRDISFVVLGRIITGNPDFERVDEV